MAPVTVVEGVLAATALGGVAGFTLAAVAWRQRQVPASGPLAALSLAGGLWAMSDIVLLVSPTVEIALVVDIIHSAIVVHIPFIWTVFVIVYTGHSEWLTRRRFALLWAPFGVYVVALATAPWHALSPTTVEFVTVHGWQVPDVANGPLTAIGTVGSYCYMVVGFLLLGRFYLRSRNVYRKQTAAILVGTTIPFLGHGIQEIVGPLHPGIDVIPVLFVAYAAFVGLALYRYDFLQVGPVVGDVLVDELPDPVVVLDSDDCVVDYNPAAATHSRCPEPMGSHVDEVVPGASENLDPPKVFQVRGEWGDGSGMTLLDPQTTSIEDQYGNRHGTLVVFRDVTTQHRRLDQLEALQSASQRFIGARTDEEVADIAVSVAANVLEQPYAVVDAYDESRDALVPLSMTGALEAAVPAEALVVERGDGRVWDVYESMDLDVLDEQHPIVERDEIPVESGLLLPLGEHGVLSIGSDEQWDYSRDDKQFARILARTTETALTRIEHEQRLRERKRALERRNDQIEFFNGILRHNIRNGMLVIDGHARHLQAELDNGHEELDVISEWSDDLTELTEKVRAIKDTLSASERKRLDEVDLSRHLTEDVPRIVSDYHGSFDLDIHDGVVVHANELVSDVIESLVRNAFEHNDSADPWVEIRTRRAGDWVQVHIEDNGPGISDEMKERVFEKDVATSQTAAGFGLYFVAVMMDLYGGKVWLEDGESGGAEAILEFRLADQAALVET